MLTYNQAITKINKHSFCLNPKSLVLGQALGRVLAKDVYSPEAFPSFNNSAVDGYAVSDLARSEFKVRGEIAAGQNFTGKMRSRQAMQIFTGAPVPRGARAVVMQEHTERINGTVRLLRPAGPQENIRFRGEDFKRGALLIRRGTVLEPAHLALLAAVGHTQVSVIPPPVVSILATGSELVGPGERLAPGKIRCSNLLLLESLVKKWGCVPKVLPLVGDNRGKIRLSIRKGLGSDLFLISGGVSVGKYDLVREALRNEGVQEIFWKVNIKPGKPLYFGKKGRGLVFGLPGNPVSVFVTFEEFVKPVILRMKGRTPEVNEVQGILTKEFCNGPRLHFVRANCVFKKSGYRVTPLRGQGSHQVGSLAQANALFTAGPEAVLKKGQNVSVKLL